MSLEDDLVLVWRQVMEEDVKTVTLHDASYPVRRTSRTKLREVDLRIEGRPLRGVEQNPATSSQWARMAKQGKKVMQFLEDGRYVAVVAEGRLTLYHGKK